MSFLLYLSFLCEFAFKAWIPLQQKVWRWSRHVTESSLTSHKGRVLRTLVGRNKNKTLTQIHCKRNYIMFDINVYVNAFVFEVLHTRLSKCQKLNLLGKILEWKRIKSIQNVRIDIVWIAIKQHSISPVNFNPNNSITFEIPNKIHNEN